MSNTDNTYSQDFSDAEYRRAPVPYEEFVSTSGETMCRLEWGQVQKVSNRGLTTRILNQKDEIEHISETYIKLKREKEGAVHSLKHCRGRLREELQRGETLRTALKQRSECLEKSQGDLHQALVRVGDLEDQAQAMQKEIKAQMHKVNLSETLIYAQKDKIEVLEQDKSDASWAAENQRISDMNREAGVWR